MASAAAVGVNAVLSRDDGNYAGERGYVDEDGAPGEVVSGVFTKSDMDANGNVEADDIDHYRGTIRRRGPDEAPAVEDGDGERSGQAGGVEDDDLFGDEEDEEAAAQEKPERRMLDDEELDSGDDLDRADRAAEEEQPSQEQQFESKEILTMEVEMARQALPEPSDGEMYLLKVPDFMAIEPKAYSHTTFTPPTTEHHSSSRPAATFSAYNTALSTIRWRRSPSDPAELQSNARVLRWSDGSLTLQLASQPLIQYEIDGNALAPPLRNPIKPTPVSVRTTQQKGGRQGDGTIAGERYDHSKDAFTYLLVPSEASQAVRVTHKITAGLSVRQSEAVTDDAIERLQSALANAANATKVHGANGMELKLIDEDPEKQRKQAEEYVKQQMRAKKRQEAAAQRELDRSNRTLGRSGLSSGRYGGGLNASMLENDEGMAGGRPRKSGATPRKQRRRRNSIYSDDEDFGRKRFATKEDEYDEEDDFVAPSDEEELVDDDEDPDDGIVEEPRRERTPKRDREPAAVAGEGSVAGDDADAEGEIDEEVVQQARSKKRRIVDEDEDEE